MHPQIGQFGELSQEMGGKSGAWQTLHPTTQPAYALPHSHLRFATRAARKWGGYGKNIAPLTPPPAAVACFSLKGKALGRRKVGMETLYGNSLTDGQMHDILKHSNRISF